MGGITGVSGTIYVGCSLCAVGVVVGVKESGWYQVKDASGAMEVISREDIITDQEDADRLLRVSTHLPSSQQPILFSLSDWRSSHCPTPLLPTQLCSR